MATKVLSRIRNPLVNALSQANVSLHSYSATKHAQSASQGFARAFTSLSPITAVRKEMSPFSTITERLGLLRSTGPAFRSGIPRPNCGPPVRLPWQSQSLRFNTSGKYANVRMKFAKQRRNRGEIKGTSNNKVCFGSYGLQVLEPAWITAKQITAGQLAIKRNMKGGKLLLRIFPHKPISLKPAETRMGRGKGNVAFWVAGVKAGRIIYEISGVPESVARRAITVASSKFPVPTRFVKSS